MTMSPEDRAEVSRRNDRLGNGPSEAGESRSRGNALKDGLLRARTLPLPQEDQAASANRADEWHNDDKPRSPSAIHLTKAPAVERAVAAPGAAGLPNEPSTTAA